MIEKIEKIGALLTLFVAAIGLVAGVGYLCMYGEYVPAVCVMVLAVLAWPSAVKLWKVLNGLA